MYEYLNHSDSPGCVQTYSIMLFCLQQTEELLTFSGITIVWLHLPTRITILEIMVFKLHFISEISQ